MTGLPPNMWNSDDFDVSFYRNFIYFLNLLPGYFPYCSLLLCCVDVVILVIELFAGQEDV
jgi:hypothetical protein